MESQALARKVTIYMGRPALLINGDHFIPEYSEQYTIDSYWTFLTYLWTSCFIIGLGATVAFATVALLLAIILIITLSSLGSRGSKHEVSHLWYLRRAQDEQ